MTPFTSFRQASVHQKHPPPKVASLVKEGEADLVFLLGWRVFVGVGFVCFDGDVPHI